MRDTTLLFLFKRDEQKICFEFKEGDIITKIKLKNIYGFRN